MTPEQRAEIDAAIVDRRHADPFARIFLAGLRMGRAEGREQAAKACHNSLQVQGPYFATLIRALPEEPT